MTMGERIKQLRREHGMTQSALAAELGVTKGTVSTWETNSRTPNFDTLTAMSEMFQRSLDYIMGRSDDATPHLGPAEAELEDLALCQVEEDLTEYALKYARLDEYGRNAVEAIIRTEYSRCRDQSTLAEPVCYYGNISIRRNTTRE